MGSKFTHIIGYSKREAFESLRNCFIYHYSEYLWNKYHEVKETNDEPFGDISF